MLLFASVGRVDFMDIKYSVCPHDCPDTCSWKVELSDGKIKKIVGDPAQPITQGLICEKARYYPERVYGQDRILYPMKRSGLKKVENLNVFLRKKLMHKLSKSGQNCLRNMALNAYCHTHMLVLKG